MVNFPILFALYIICWELLLVLHTYLTTWFIFCPKNWKWLRTTKHVMYYYYDDDNYIVDAWLSAAVCQQQNMPRRMPKLRARQQKASIDHMHACMRWSGNYIPMGFDMQQQFYQAYEWDGAGLHVITLELYRRIIFMPRVPGWVEWGHGQYYLPDVYSKWYH